MSDANFDFKSFSDERVLIANLVSTATKQRLSNVRIGLLVNGDRFFAATGAQFEPVAKAEREPIEAGCIAKVVTATLVAESVADGKLDWHFPVAAMLADSFPLRGVLSGVNVRHLLDHTHGLDGSALREAPRTKAGKIDLVELCRRVAATPKISDPGELYSYSNTGAWIAASILERLYNKKYADILRERGFCEAHSKAGSVCDSSVCPATGGDLALTGIEWLAFLEAHLHSYGDLRHNPVPLPGWSPAEQGAGLGWKSYGRGWFGHNSNLADTSALLRVCPEQQVAMVVAAPKQAAFLALAGLFGNLLPEFAHLRPPRLLTAAERGAVDFERCPGIYARALDTIEIAATEESTLTFRVLSERAEREVATRRLQLAQGGVFVPEPRDLAEFGFIQFVPRDGQGARTHLWNGKQLWRKT